MSDKELKIHLSRLEDQLVGYLEVGPDTTIDHMVRRIEYAHEEVVKALKMMEVPETDFGKLKRRDG